MPMIVYKEKLNRNGNNEIISISFNCKYNSDFNLVIENNELLNFVSDDFRTKIKEALRNLDDNIYEKYMEKNNGVYYLAITNYLIDKIPSIYSVKFETDTSESIYYNGEVKKYTCK